MFDWDDLKHFLAVARHGSTTAAGRALNTDQSTVQRRITRLEQRIGQPLVERHPSGYRLTAYGQQLLPHAQLVEQHMLALQNVVQSSARELNGVIRLTCPEPIVSRITGSGLLERLSARHPGLRVEFVMSDHYVDLGKGEADVAFRSGDTVDNALIGRKIADSLWAVYGGREYLARHGSPQRLEDLAQHAWIGFDASMAKHRATQWLHDVAPHARVVATSGSVLGAVHSVKANVGLGALPKALGDAEPDLVRVLGPIPELTRSWRMLTTRQLRRTPRVQAFFAFMASEMDTLRPILTG
ncbi:MAG: LysR family transcriptional regulator [Polaromonas sp.]|uniref:LysR family transcriptional regulator n=1 Tax=Polaromonas sp. TaxID=1869339 RepID=UPI00248A12E7|nr:LysR family transcriptional regulator [Polaromonas sp.]MDI1238066.1 LysR family transcriptional regulator [Polaromonas sp.]